MEPKLVPGRKWVGWGPEKGMVCRVLVHQCPTCGPVVVGSIDEARTWLRSNAFAADACWDQVLSEALAVDQAIWSKAFATGEIEERARRLSGGR